MTDTSMAKAADRVVLIEDTRELWCAATNLVAMRTKEGVASLSDLVRAALRLRPDRIPIGEVRGPEALDLLKAWGTGHPGTIGTIHSDSAIGALLRPKRATCCIKCAPEELAVSIHTPAKGATMGNSCSSATFSFYPRPREGSDLLPHNYLYRKTKWTFMCEAGVWREMNLRPKARGMFLSWHFNRISSVRTSQVREARFWFALEGNRII